MPHTSLIPQQFPKYHPEVIWSFLPFIILPNLTIIIAFIADSKLRLTANYFVCSLACGDFLVGAVLLPTVLIGPWNSSGYVILFTYANTMMLTCACAHDRYVAIKDPLHYQNRLRMSKVYIILCVCWLVPILIAMIPAIWIRGVEDQLLMENRIFIGVCSLSVLIAVISQIVAYCVIFRIARGQIKTIRKIPKISTSSYSDKVKLSRKIHNIMKELMFAKLFAAVAFTFLLFWIPICYINLVDNVFLRPDLMPMWVQEMSFYCMWFSSMINPFLYGLFQKAFRKSIFSWLRRFFCSNSTKNGALMALKRTAKTAAS